MSYDEPIEFGDAPIIEPDAKYGMFIGGYDRGEENEVESAEENESSLKQKPKEGAKHSSKSKKHKSKM